MEPQLSRTIEELIRRIVPGRENVIDLARQLDKDGTPRIMFQVGQRALQDEQPLPPVRQESSARKHTFHTAEAMRDYLLAYGTAHTVILGNIATGVAMAVLDETAKDGRECVGLEPMIHPLFEPWAKVVGQTLKIGAFAEMLIENRRAIVQDNQGHSGRDVAMLFRQVRISNRVTAQKGAFAMGKGAVLNGVMCETTVEGKSNSDFVALPESLIIAVPIYVGPASRSIELDLTVVASAEEAGVRISAADLAEARVGACEEMFTVLQGIEVDGKDFIVGLGTVDYRRWAYLEDAPEEEYNP